MVRDWLDTIKLWKLTEWEFSLTFHSCQISDPIFWNLSRITFGFQQENWELTKFAIIHLLLGLMKEFKKTSSEIKQKAFFYLFLEDFFCVYSWNWRHFSWDIFRVALQLFHFKLNCFFFFGKKWQKMIVTWKRHFFLANDNVRFNL